MSTVFLHDSLFDFHSVNRQSLLANLSKKRGFLILNELNTFSVDALKLISNWVKMGNTLVFIPSAQLNAGVLNRLNANFSSQGNSFKLEILSQALAVRLPIKHARFFNSILEESSFKKNLEMFNSNSYLQWDGGVPIFEYVNGKPFCPSSNWVRGLCMFFQVISPKIRIAFLSTGYFFLFSKKWLCITALIIGQLRSSPKRLKLWHLGSLNLVRLKKS